MRINRDRQRSRRPLGVNLTAMVDVIFMLTIFFMLVTRFSSAEQMPMQLPEPDESKAAVAELPERETVNCRLADPTTGGVLYSLGPNRPESLDVIADRLVARKRESPNLKVVVRADRRLEYRFVRDLMRVIADSGVDVLNVVAHVAERE